MLSCPGQQWCSYYLVDSIARTSEPDEPVNGVTPCWTGDEEYDDYEGNVVLPQTGSDEPVDSVACTSRPDVPVNGVTPCWTGDKECDVYEGDVHLTQTGSDEPVNSVVCTSGRMSRSAVKRPAGSVLRNVSLMRVRLPCPGPGPMGRSTVLLVHPGRITRMASVLRMVLWECCFLTPDQSRSDIQLCC